MRQLMLRPSPAAREIDNLFSDFWRFPGFRTENDADFMPPVNIAENDQTVRLTFEVPGMEKKDIKVTIKDSTLSVSGERHFTKEDKDGDYIRTEIRQGSFCRSFSLPDTVQADKIHADYKNGLLEVTLPKRPEAKPKEIDIRVA